MSIPAIEWHSEAETPDHHPVSVIIAVHSDCGDGAIFLSGDPWEWRGDHWQNERTGEPMPFGEKFFWMPEEPLLALIPRTSDPASTAVGVPASPQPTGATA